MPGQEQLKIEIIDSDLCSSCGACVNLCPYIKTINDKVKVIYPCGQKEGTCYYICPKRGLNLRETDLKVFGREREDHALGVTSGVYFAKAINKTAGAQYSGVATMLMELALERGTISGAVLTGGSISEPRPQLALTAEEIRACAGSKYTGVPTLAVLNSAITDGYTSLGVVGRPCQVTAVRRALLYDLPGKQYTSPGSVGLIIGLFCFWSLTSDLYKYFSRQFMGEEIISMDIPLGGPVFKTKTGTFQRNIEEIRPFIKNSCLSCFDSTSEWADISVGSTEYDDGWNTLIVRTPGGKDLVELARQEGLIELIDYPEQRLPMLKKAVLNKKMKVLSQTETVNWQPGQPVLSQNYQEKLREQWGGVNQ